MKKLITVLLVLGVMGTLVSCASTKGASGSGNVGSDEINVQLQEIRTNEKVVLEDGDTTTKVELLNLRGKNNIRYTVEHKSTGASEVIFVENSDDGYKIRFYVTQEQEFPNGFGEFFAFFINKDPELQLKYEGEPSVHFSKPKAGGNMYSLAFKITKAELKRLQSASSVFAFVGHATELNGQAYAAEDKSVTTNKLFSAALKEFIK